MSQQQLTRLTQEKERLLKTYERSKQILKVSEACSDLVNFSKSKVDPFSPEYKEPNPWDKARSEGCCLII